MSEDAPRNHLEALMDTLVKWLQNTGDSPVEIGLSEKHFLALASDLGFEVAGAPLRIVYRMRPLAFSVPVSMDANYELAEVRIGDSFVFQGPGGPVTIRNSDAKPVQPHLLETTT